MIIPLLWLAQVVVFVVAALGPWRDADGGRPRLPVRIALSASMVFAAQQVLVNLPPEADGYGLPVLIGMLLSFIGDLLMAKLIPFPNRLLGGMLAFGAAHAMYIGAYYDTVAQRAIAFPMPVLGIALAVYGLIVIGGWWRFIRNPKKPLIINLGALIYGSWIGVMASFAFAFAYALGGLWWIAAAGGAIFVSSDFLIGITDIRGVHLPNERIWVWATYLAGQMGIIYASWAATL